MLAAPSGSQNIDHRLPKLFFIDDMANRFVKARSDPGKIRQIFGVGRAADEQTIAKQLRSTVRQKLVHDAYLPKRCDVKAGAGPRELFIDNLRAVRQKNSLGEKE